MLIADLQLVVANAPKTMAIARRSLLTACEGKDNMPLNEAHMLQHVKRQCSGEHTELRAPLARAV